MVKVRDWGTKLICFISKQTFSKELAKGMHIYYTTLSQQTVRESTGVNNLSQTS